TPDAVGDASGPAAAPLPGEARPRVAVHHAAGARPSEPAPAPRRSHGSVSIRAARAALIAPSRAAGDVASTHEGAGVAFDWPEIWRAARAAASEGDLATAEALCHQATVRWTLRPEPHYLLGVLSQTGGDESAALVSFRKALYVDRTFVPALLAV